MAKFIIEFEDNDDGGLKSKIELVGFNGVTSENLDKNTCAQNMYFAVNGFLVNQLGLKIPEVNALDADT